MARPREGSSVSFTSDSEPEDEDLIGFFEGITQSCVDANFSDGDESTSASAYISWRMPSNELSHRGTSSEAPNIISMPHLQPSGSSWRACLLHWMWQFQTTST
ncbi:unnamed protein product [Fusarium fujikuroi]|nr:hypothetical protein CEK25_010297 [Fusarium fujikuroi]VZI10207.1 unnamed protein product [Fusarium fujikuroi]